ncbi:helix-turn-helix domain-containing protein [Lichenifustis flavocetrariae]|uniref:Helix-turn-helix domain-containing protein n=1 Tax=Lichenifustis flavocetrariae TaxID=2949735 RepID=A0AA42CKW3_9HYPH|nr:helix-turn-helix domain-containing protein [Lichenifustis flavocetrariae]MCW6510999.1 helix-turn-helix domain-containing protein [Lichenifustis flavocetrariae]
MAIVRVTGMEAKAKGRIDEARVEALTEDDIRRFNAEDGFDPDDTLKGLSRAVSPADIRKRLNLSQEKFARGLRIPVATLRNWEQGRTRPDPVAISLFALVDADPQRAFEVLAEEKLYPPTSSTIARSAQPVPPDRSHSIVCP